MKKIYRKGGVGAMMDEYERSAWELKDLIAQINDADFERVVDAETTDEGCRSVQTIMSHVVRAGYGYAGYIRKAFEIPSEIPPHKLLTKTETLEQIDAFLRFTETTLDGRWEMSDDELMETKMTVGWGPTYDLEQLLEHAIVHILRHRRQIEKFAAAGLISVNSANK